ncbi:hypothetical protein [Nocardioides sp. L-11A]|uniref:hypothetical protein n=1 Tax=Nocardioides sp. L-11A TaxID=3043848 RepID=UPI00249AC4D2|nr:hypothetical protein QJ852_06820 [Nocardioides sp. L-11A]
MTERLREMLARAVPDDAPVFEPHALAARARRRRNRGRAVGAGLATAVLAIGLAGTLASTGGDEDPPVARDPDPYAVPACPDPFRMPTTTPEVPSYDGLVGVRLCAEQAGPGADGLVELDGLPARVAALDDFDPGRCAAIDVIPLRQLLLFGYADGSTVEVPATMCSPAGIDGRQVDGGDLLGAYLDALAAQRDGLAAGRPYIGAFDCAALPASSAARPGHERITSGAVCRGFGDQPAEPLTEEQVQRVADAWADPGPLRLAKCTPPDEPLSLLLGTDRGDVVQVQDGCTTLTWTGPTEGQSASLPVSMAELGLTP